MEDFHWKYDDLEFGWDENGNFYRRMKKKYEKSYKKAKEDTKVYHFATLFLRKCIILIQSGLFCGPVMTFFSKFLFLSSLLVITLYILLLFSHAVFGI